MTCLKVAALYVGCVLFGLLAGYLPVLAGQPECRPGYEYREYQHAEGVKVGVCRPLSRTNLTCETRRLPSGGTERICYRIRPVAPKRVKASEVRVHKPRQERKFTAEELMDQILNNAKTPQRRPVEQPVRVGRR